MKVQGICSLCGNLANPAYSCILCGVICCFNCFNPRKQTCKNCGGKQ